jgi:outer membrane protein assembly factor BamB
VETMFFICQSAFYRLFTAKAKHVSWKKNLDATSIYASAVFCNQGKRLFACTLGGNVFCLRAHNGQVEWVHKLAKPCFGSVSVDERGENVFVGECSGVFACLAVSTGELVGLFELFKSKLFDCKKKNEICINYRNGRIKSMDPYSARPWHYQARLYSWQAMITFYTA